MMASRETHPVETSHIRIVLSRLPVIMKSPLGRNLTAETESSCPCSVFVFLYSLFVSHILREKSFEQETGSQPVSESVI